MNLGAQLTIWGWMARIGLLLLLLTTGAVYVRGWVLAQSNADSESRPKQWHMATFIAGLAMTGLALISWLEALTGEYFSVRVVQHVLLTAVVPFLLLVADPYETIRMGLPASAENYLSRQSKKHSRYRAILKAVTAPSVVWVVFVANFWLWHDAMMIEAARTMAWVHVIEVFSLLGTACLYWWHIAGAAPRLHTPMTPVIRILYSFIGMVPIKLMGMVLLFGAETMVGNGGGRVVYDSAEKLVTIGSITVADRSLGAIIIWVLGGVTYTYAATFLAGRFVGQEEEKPSMAVSLLEDDSNWIAPGIGKGR